MELPRDSYLQFGPYHELMTGVRTALSINEGIIKIVGGNGTGKSAFCRQLQDELETTNFDVIFFETPPESSDFLYQRIQSQLGLDKNKDFNRTLTRYLLAKTPPDNKLVIIYDDAEKIDKEIFILIRLLNNIHDQSETLVSQIICGTRELDRRFDDPDLRSLTQYLNQSFELHPLDREGFADFCAGYLKQISTPAVTVSEKELDKVFKQAKGLPGQSLEKIQALLEARVDKTPGEKKKTKKKKKKEKAKTKGKEKSRKGKTGTSTPSALSADRLASEDAGETNEATAIQDLGDVENPPILEDIISESQGAPAKSARQKVITALLDDPVYQRRSWSSSLTTGLKVAGGIILLVVSIIIGAIISSDDRRQNAGTRLAEILADDSPLYMDEVVDDSVQQEAAPAADPVLPVVQANTAARQFEPDVADDAAPLAIARSQVNTQEVAAGDESPAAETGVAAGTLAAPGEREAESDVALVDESVAAESVPSAAPAVTVTTGDSAQEDIAANPPETDSENTVAQAPVKDAIEDTIMNTIDDWIAAWQAHNVEDYFAAYHEDFEPVYQDSLSEWREQRTANISRPTEIIISVDRFEWIEQGDDTAVIQFWLAYSRQGYADDTLKEVRLAPANANDEEWRITLERNLIVEVH